MLRRIIFIVIALIILVGVGWLVFTLIDGATDNDDQQVAQEQEAEREQEQMTQEEQNRQAETERQAEEQRQRDEAQQAEQRRQEEQRRAEEERQRQQASTQAPPQTPQPEGNSLPSTGPEIGLYAGGAVTMGLAVLYRASRQRLKESLLL